MGPLSVTSSAVRPLPGGTADSRCLQGLLSPIPGSPLPSATLPLNSPLNLCGSYAEYSATPRSRKHESPSSTCRPALTAGARPAHPCQHKPRASGSSLSRTTQLRPRLAVSERRRCARAWTSGQRPLCRIAPFAADWLQSGANRQVWRASWLHPPTESGTPPDLHPRAPLLTSAVGCACLPLLPHLDATVRAALLPRLSRVVGRLVPCPLMASPHGWPVRNAVHSVRRAPSCGMEAT